VALIRGLVYSLVENGRIKTTLARAKEVRRHVERAITLGKKDSLHSRRLLMSRYPNENVVEILSTDLQKRFAKRPGGYTRIVKVGARAGDQSDMAFLEFVDYVPAAATGEETVKGDKEAPKKSRARVVARERARKRVRRIQATSRREARA
jgi:large subunit ribosomal protein L17